MKTAEEWYILETGRADMDWYVEQNKTDYIERTKQIQLDAMKEGMRRAVKCVYNHNTFAEVEESIIAAAEQLTEKDL